MNASPPGPGSGPALPTSLDDLAPLPGHQRGIWPGLVLTGTITAAAFSLRELPGAAMLSPMILAVLAGMVFANVLGRQPPARAGLAFSQHTLLRLGIVLLGFQLTAGQVLAFGAGGLAIAASALAATFVFTLALGRLLGIDAGLVRLIAAGTSICGASAIVATNAVARAREEDVAYAVAAITLFGTAAMLAYPLLAPVLGLDPYSFGIWAGTSIHEVAQVVGAGFQLGEAAGEAGVVAKLARVAMLAPMVILLGMAARRDTSAASPARPPVPWFVLGFIAVVALNSVVDLPARMRDGASLAATLLLTLGLAAVGLQTDISALRSRGLAPLLLALAASLFIACISLALVKLLG